MSIAGQLLRRCSDHERKSGEPATAIYLGRYTHCDLKQELHWATDAAAFHGQRDQFNGLPIFVVDEEHHMNVG